MVDRSEGRGGGRKRGKQRSEDPWGKVQSGKNSGEKGQNSGKKGQNSGERSIMSAAQFSNIFLFRIDMDSPLAHGNNAKNTPVTGSQTDSGVFTLGSSSAVAAAAIAANGKMAQ